VKPTSLFLFALTALATAAVAAEKKPMNSTAPASDKPAAGQTERITFGGGCFWCVEAVFQRLKGVTKVVSGYAGGHVANPTYKQVCEETTGHAEVVQLEFDPSEVTYDKLMEVFWAAHDPTTLNRQGHDVGTQYRSIVLFENEKQKAAAEKSKTTAQKDFKDPIVTEIVPLKQFYVAEDYHQNYYNQNGDKNPYCQVVIRPKLTKLLSKGLIREDAK
jgi:peptide-methionine (S)-S-oxide reductase